jgi:hypothetical protein
MMRFRKLMLTCFLCASLIFLWAGIPLVPSLFHMNAGTEALVNNGRVFSTGDRLMLLVAQMLTLAPAVLGLLSGIAFFALQTRKRSGRLSAIIASTAFLVSTAIFMLDDVYLNQHGPVLYAPGYFLIVAVQLIMGVGGLLAFGYKGRRPNSPSQPG